MHACSSQERQFYLVVGKPIHLLHLTSSCCAVLLKEPFYV